jgi:hypothetical protein
VTKGQGCIFGAGTGHPHTMEDGANDRPKRETGSGTSGGRTRRWQKTRNSGDARIPCGGKRKWVKVEVRDQIAKEESTTNK